MTEQV